MRGETFASSWRELYPAQPWGWNSIARLGCFSLPFVRKRYKLPGSLGPAQRDGRRSLDSRMITLARKLRTTDYFALGFGTMVGVGWLVVMDDWLARGGPLGAILGFAIGGATLLPIAIVYGRLAMAIPDAASEIAYTAAVFPPSLSFATGWMMTLAYLVVCPWECVAVGKIAAYIFPAMNSQVLYRLGGNPVFLPQLALGLGLALVITGLNFRGIRASATFQNWTTFGTLALFVVFASLGLARGNAANFPPLFSRGRLVSILLVVQIVPYFMTGFESVPKSAEEASPDFRLRGFSRAILLALIVGILFYVSVIAVVAFIRPWSGMKGEYFATAAAFEQAFGSRRIVDLVLAAALLSLLKIFNGNFVAASRLVFALGRRGLIDPRWGKVHPEHQTPFVAVFGVGLVTAFGALMGESILIPITEVGSMASAVGWLATCAAYYRMEHSRRARMMAALGIAVGGALILLKLAPFVPGHFTGTEYLAVALWALVGLGMRLSSRYPAGRDAA